MTLLIEFLLWLFPDVAWLANQRNPSAASTTNWVLLGFFLALLAWLVLRLGS